MTSTRDLVVMLHTEIEEAARANHDYLAGHPDTPAVLSPAARVVITCGPPRRPRIIPTILACRGREELAPCDASEVAAWMIAEQRLAAPQTNARARVAWRDHSISVFVLLDQEDDSEPLEIDCNGTLDPARVLERYPLAFSRGTDVLLSCRAPKLPQAGERCRWQAEPGGMFALRGIGIAQPSQCLVLDIKIGALSMFYDAGGDMRVPAELFAIEPERQEQVGWGPPARPVVSRERLQEVLSRGRVALTGAELSTLINASEVRAEFKTAMRGEYITVETEGACEGVILWGHTADERPHTIRRQLQTLAADVGRAERWRSES